MMHAIQEWLAAVVVVAMLLSVVQVLIPEGPIRKIASFTGGLILMVTLLRPVLGMDLSRLELRLHTYEAAIQDRQQELEENGKTELAKLIEERTAAYISDKGAALGVNCHAVVETELRSGVPYPCAVTLDVERNETLAACIAADLGIGKEAQVWQAAGER